MSWPRIIDVFDLKRATRTEAKPARPPSQLCLEEKSSDDPLIVVLREIRDALRPLARTPAAAAAPTPVQEERPREVYATLEDHVRDLRTAVHGTTGRMVESLALIDALLKLPERKGFNYIVRPEWPTGARVQRMHLWIKARLGIARQELPDRKGYGFDRDELLAAIEKRLSTAELAKDDEVGGQ